MLSQTRGAGIFGLVLLIASTDATAQNLSRVQAVDALLNPGSGFSFDPTVTALWCPQMDFGFGPAYEGLLPALSTIFPEMLDEQPFPGSAATLANPSYLFWLDEQPSALFGHATRFVFLDATNPSPTIFNGGIQESPQGWWPVVTLPDGTTRALFETIHEKVTDHPAGAANPDGLIAGIAPEHSDIIILPPPGPLPDPSPLPPPPSQPNACALLIRGHTDEMFGNDMKKFEKDLRDRLGVPADRIIKANDGDAATCTDIDTAIDALCALKPPCTKIYVRFTTHGLSDLLMVAKDPQCRSGKLRAREFCRKMQKLAQKGVPICMLINACYSGSMLDSHNWDFPAGSSIITVTDENHTGWGGPYTAPDGAKITEGLYTHAFSLCLNDNAADADKDGVVDDCEAHKWVLDRKPCYGYKGGMYYPADHDNVGGGQRNPQKRTVGRDPTECVVHVCNRTGQDKTDFHLIFKGDVRQGIAKAWESNRSGNKGARWARDADDVVITYDSETDTTMVCFIDADHPIENDDYIVVSFKRAVGGLKPVRQFWTPTPEPADPADRVPPSEGKITPKSEERSVGVRIITRGDENGGWGMPVVSTINYRFAPAPISDDLLAPGDPPYVELPVLGLGDHVLLPDQPLELDIPIPAGLGKSATLILELHQSWDLNETRTIQLLQFAPFQITTRRFVSSDEVGMGHEGSADAPLEVATPEVEGPRCGLLNLMVLALAVTGCAILKGRLKRLR